LRFVELKSANEARMSLALRSKFRADRQLLKIRARSQKKAKIVQRFELVSMTQVDHPIPFVGAPTNFTADSESADSQAND